MKCRWFDAVKTKILIPCTASKQIPAPSKLKAQSLHRGTIFDVANEWIIRKKDAASNSYTHSSIYGGLAYQMASRAASMLQSDLLVISAGMGLVQPDQKIPSYSLTIANGGPDCIREKITCRQTRPSDWWKALKSISSNCHSIEPVLGCSSTQLVLLCLSTNYAKLVYDDLTQVSNQTAQRLRIFGAGISRHLPDKLKNSVMPYDAKLNGPDSPFRGTTFNFGSRALLHFASHVRDGRINGNSLDEDKAILSNLMAGWRYPKFTARQSISDDDIVQFIRKQWAESNNRSRLNVNLLRNQGFACSAERFQKLRGRYFSL